MRFAVAVTAHGRTLARTTFRRAWSFRPIVTREETVATTGFEGVYFRPRGVTHRPAVLLFGGSEGGLQGSSPTDSRPTDTRLSCSRTSKHPEYRKNC
jgi:hypothetical protein